jgi:hypothetical protein
MQLFQNIDSNIFTYNGIKYVKNFMIIKQGDTNISVHNAYDTSFQLMGSTHYSQVKVNGVSYSNQANLMGALSTLIFAKQIVDTAGVLLTISGVTDTYTTGATYSDGTAVFTNNYDGTFSLSGLTDTLQNATDKNNTSTNSIRIIDAADDNTFGELKKNQLIFHKSDGSGVGFNADNTTEYYRLQAPDKTGGGDFTIATTDDFDSINLDTITSNGNSTNNSISVDSVNLWDAANENFGGYLGFNDGLFIFNNNINSNPIATIENGSLGLINGHNKNTYITNHFINNDNLEFRLPNKTGTTYTLATTEDFSGINEAPVDGVPYVRENGVWVRVTLNDITTNAADSSNDNNVFGKTIGFADFNTLNNAYINGDSIAFQDAHLGGAGSKQTIISKDGISLKGGVSSSTFAQSLVGASATTSGQTFTLPNKPSGNYTLLTTSDLNGYLPLSAYTNTFVTGGTYSNGTTTFKNNSGGTFSVSGYSTGYTLTSSAITNTLGYTPLSTYIDTYTTGATKSGNVVTFTNNTGGTFSLTGLTDTYTTGGTLNQSSGVATFINNTGGTFNVTGFSDTYTTGGTYNNGITTFINNTGGTFTVTGFPTSYSVSALTDIKTYTEVMQGRWIFSDMLYTSSIQPFVGGALSAGSIVGGTDVSDYVCGVNVLRSTTTTNSGYNIYLNQAILGNLKGSEIFETQLVHYNLSGTTTRFGFGANVNSTSDFTYGVYFEILGDQLYAKTANNSTRTSVLLGTVPSASNYYAYRITIISPSSVNYSVYNASGGSSVFSTNITTNIPSTYTSYNSSMKANVATFSSGTVVNSLCGIDYIKIYLGDQYNRGPIRI